jgi:putative tricarboxylic transport membrane protein
VFGIIGAIFLSLDFPVSPIVLGFVLGPMLEENFRRAMLLSRGDLMVFLNRPIAAWFIGACSLLIIAQVIAYARKLRLPQPARDTAEMIPE